MFTLSNDQSLNRHFFCPPSSVIICNVDPKVGTFQISIQTWPCQSCPAHSTSNFGRPGASLALSQAQAERRPAQYHVGHCGSDKVRKNAVFTSMFTSVS